MCYLVPLRLFMGYIDVTQGMTLWINGELKEIWKLFIFGLLGNDDLQSDLWVHGQEYYKDFKWG